MNFICFITYITTLLLILVYSRVHIGLYIYFLPCQFIYWPVRKFLLSKSKLFANSTVIPWPLSMFEKYLRSVWDLRFTRPGKFELWSSGLRRRVVSQVIIKVSEELIAFICRGNVFLQNFHKYLQKIHGVMTQDHNTYVLFIYLEGGDWEWV